MAQLHEGTLCMCFVCLSVLRVPVSQVAVASGQRCGGMCGGSGCFDEEVHMYREFGRVRSTAERRPERLVGYVGT